MKALQLFQIRKSSLSQVFVTKQWHLSQHLQFLPGFCSHILHEMGTTHLTTEKRLRNLETLLGLPTVWLRWSHTWCRWMVLFKLRSSHSGSVREPVRKMELNRKMEIHMMIVIISCYICTKTVTWSIFTVSWIRICTIGWTTDLVQKRAIKCLTWRLICWLLNVSQGQLDLVGIVSQLNAS